MPTLPIQDTIAFCRKHNFSFFPVAPYSKQPLIKWTEFQKRHPTNEEAEYWMSKWPNMNIGIPTGSNSKLIVVDLDSQKGTIDCSQFELPETLTIKTGGGGEHYYYQYDAERDGEIRNIAGVFPYVDIRGEGGYIVAPGSVHQKGNRYTIISDESIEIAPCPIWVRTQKSKLLQKVELPNTINSKGTRHDKTIKWFGWYYGESSSNDPKDIWDALCDYNNKENEEPLPEEELKGIYEYVQEKEEQKYNSEGTKRKGHGNTGLCLEFLNSSGRLVRERKTGNPYYVNKRCTYLDLYPIFGKATKLKGLIRTNIFQSCGKDLTDSTLDGVCSILRHKTEGTGEMVDINIRIGKDEEGAILYDLLNTAKQCIRIDDKGWKLETFNPGYFIRTKSSLPQVIPARTGDINRIWKYINIRDEGMRNLVLCTILSYFIPNIQHPMMLVFGPKGSAKSTFLLVVKRIVDPSGKEKLLLPIKTEDIIHTVLRDHVVTYDNISKISLTQSDVLCRLVTGGSLSKRALYTDDDDILDRFEKCIIMNGINLEVTEPDALQRSVLIELDSIEPSNRKSEIIFWEEFQQDLPYILGGIFDILSRAIGIETKIRDVTDTPFRLADYNRWGEAISQALGNKPGLLTNLILSNHEDDDEVVTESSEVASVIIAFMSKKPEWTGTATKLLAEINYELRPSKFFPTTPNMLSKGINRVKDNLKNMDILIKNDRMGGERIIIIENMRYKKIMEVAKNIFGES